MPVVAVGVPVVIALAAVPVVLAVAVPVVLQNKIPVLMLLSMVAVAVAEHHLVRRLLQIKKAELDIGVSSSSGTVLPDSGRVIS
jgi:hypothetical protein